MPARHPLRLVVSPLAVTLAAAVCWLALPFTAGDALDVATAGADAPGRWVIGLGAWALWAAGTAALALASTASLTVARFVVPAGLAASAAAAIAGGADGATRGPAGVIGVTAAAAATVLVLSAPFGDRAVNGSSYGAERRFALRPTAAMVVAAPLLWLLALLAVAAGPLLAAGGFVVAGVLTTMAGWPLAFAIVRRTHVLARRWLVLVPAGIVVHDPLVLTDSLLVQRRSLVGLGPAPADTDARDLTGGAFGLALEVRLREPASILTNAQRREAGGSLTAPGEQVDAVLVAASRPGAVVREAAGRGLPQGAAPATN